MMARRSKAGSSTEAISGSTRVELEPVVIQALGGPGPRAQITLRSGMMVVGTDRDGCDFVVEDRSVSRKHLSVELFPGQVRVRDLESRNGTWYLGARVKEVNVPIGGSLRMGRTTLHFSPLAGAGLEVSEREELHGLVGRSLPMRRLFTILEKLGPGDSTVLITGETGVGKSLVARALHALSPRAQRPFVVFDCSSANPELIEATLFGHVQGAFTGADKDHPGVLGTAEGGCVFLAGVNDLAIDVQPKLLRLLESKEFRPVGAQETKRADVRILASSQQDLQAGVRAGRFRADLFYRLAVSTVEVPPLRERQDDIPLLAAHFAKKKTNIAVQLAPATLAALRCHLWLGNVREFRNAVEQTVALGMGPPPEDAALPEKATYRRARAHVLEKFERDYLASLLKQNDGNVSAAAREAGLSRTQFYILLKRHGIRDGVAKD